MDFVENAMSLQLPSDIVITDCLFIIGLMIGIPFHVSDITVRDKRLNLFFLSAHHLLNPLPSSAKESVLEKVFEVLATTFFKSLQTPLTLRALRLVTRLAVKDVATASYGLFMGIIGYKRLSNYGDHRLQEVVKPKLGGRPSRNPRGIPRKHHYQDHAIKIERTR